MKVSPVNQIPEIVPRTVPQIYISREAVKHVEFDIQLLGFCDDVVSELSRRAGWTIEHGGYVAGSQAKVQLHAEDIGHVWDVKIPGKEHTVEEKANPGV